MLDFLYQNILKSVFFRLEPEDIHESITGLGRLLGSNTATCGLTRAVLAYADSILETEVVGIHFSNPVGLAAGFDKNARLMGILPAVGFGFAELGSITGQPCAGNPRPRLWRLPKSDGLVVYYGLKNDGADTIAARLQNKKFLIPIGISAAKTNSPTTAEPEAAIEDYCHVVEKFKGTGDYLTINISCPNAYGGEPFTDPQLLDRLLTATDKRIDKPVFLKLAVDLAPQQLDALLEVADSHHINGFICSNLTKNRQNMELADKLIPDKGGISGKPVRKLSDAQVAYVHRRTKGRYSIIGVGGIFSAEDAYRKIRLGSSLVQLITGMIYRGPQLIGQINRGLARSLRRDGFEHLADAVGVDNRT